MKAIKIIYLILIAAMVIPMASMALAVIPSDKRACNLRYYRYRYCGHYRFKVYPNN